MPAVFLNAAVVLLGAFLGTVFKNRISKRYTDAVIHCIALITIVIGMQSALGTDNIMTLMLCMTLGTVLGTALRLDERMNGAADRIRDRLSSTPFGKGRLSEAFVTTSILFCVGAMTVVGSLQAGLEHDYKLLYAKSGLDLISATVYAAALGPGVMLSAGTVIVVQGAIVLLAGLAAPILSTPVVAEMSAVGGAMFIAMGLNLLDALPQRVKIGDMLPGIFLPIVYIPLTQLLEKIF